MLYLLAQTNVESMWWGCPAGVRWHSLVQQANAAAAEACVGSVRVNKCRLHLWRAR